MSVNDFDLKKWTENALALVNDALDKHLPAENLKPETIHKSMRYSIFAGGKRVRPLLLLASVEACGGSVEQALPLACAVECIHTYTLIHDDLPAMDNDDLRRGRPTNHKVFGEAIAILAGDALLAEAFSIASHWNPGKNYTHKDIMHELAWQSGSQQVVGGQVVDIESEEKKISLEELQYLHEKKTSALICLSTRLGGMSADCTPEQLEALTTFGMKTGLAFQIIDDILDVEQTTEKLGKTAGKDEKVQKSTYPSLVGLGQSRRTAKQLTLEAFETLNAFENPIALKSLGELLLKRDH